MSARNREAEKMAPRVFQTKLPSSSYVTATTGYPAEDAKLTAPFALFPVHILTLPLAGWFLLFLQLPFLAASRLVVLPQKAIISVSQYRHVTSSCMILSLIVPNPSLYFHSLWYHKKQAFLSCPALTSLPLLFLSSNLAPLCCHQSPF